MPVGEYVVFVRHRRHKMKYLEITSLVLLLTASAFANDEEIEKRGGLGGFLGGAAGLGGGISLEGLGIGGGVGLGGGLGGGIGYGGYRGGYAYQPGVAYGKPTLPLIPAKPSPYVPKLLRREAQEEENRMERGWQRKLEVEPLQVQQTVVDTSPPIIPVPVQIIQPSAALRPVVQVVQPSIAVQPAIQTVQPAIQTVQTGIPSSGVSVVQSTIKKRAEIEKRGGLGGFLGGAAGLGGGISLGGLDIGGGVGLGGGLAGGIGYGGGYTYQPVVSYGKPTLPLIPAKPSPYVPKLLRREDSDHETERRYVKVETEGYPIGGLEFLGGGIGTVGGGIGTVAGIGTVGGGIGAIGGGLQEYGYQPKITVAEPIYTVSQPVAVAQPTVSTAKIL